MGNWPWPRGYLDFKWPMSPEFQRNEIWYFLYMSISSCSEPEQKNEVEDSPALIAVQVMYKFISVI